MSQILNLTLLEPDIQEELLFLPRVTEGKAVIHEKMLRPIAAEVDWTKQRKGVDAIQGHKLICVRNINFFLKGVESG